MPEDEPGIAHVVPDLIRKCLRCRRSAAADLRRRHADADAHAHRRHRRRDRHRDGLAGGRSTRTSTSRPSDELTVAEIARDHLGGVRARPRRRSRSSTCRASRSTSCAAGRASRRPSALLGWEAQIGVRRGHRADGRLAARGDAADRLDIDCSRWPRSGSVVGHGTTPSSQERRTKPSSARRPPSARVKVAAAVKLSIVGAPRGQEGRQGRQPAGRQGRRRPGHRRRRRRRLAQAEEQLVRRAMPAARSGPVASADTVSPPADAAVQTAGSDS